MTRTTADRVRELRPGQADEAKDLFPSEWREELFLRLRALPPATKRIEPRAHRTARRTVLGALAAAVALLAAATSYSLVVARSHHAHPPEMRLVSVVTPIFLEVGTSRAEGRLQCPGPSTCYLWDVGPSAASYKSTDGGRRWTGIVTPPVSGVTVPTCSTARNCMAVYSAPDEASQLSPVPVAVTADGGSHWAKRSLNVPSYVTYPVVWTVLSNLQGFATCATATKCVALVAGQRGSSPAIALWSFLTSNAGRSWRQGSLVSTWGPDALPQGLGAALGCSPDGQCTSVGLMGPIRQARGVAAFHSANYGQTWQAEPPATRAPVGGSAFAFPFNNPLATCADGTHCAVLYRGTTQAGGFWLTSTTDGGRTWQTHRAKAAGNYPVGLSCWGASCWVSWSTETISGGVIVTRHPVVEGTDDSGATWSQVPLASVPGLQEVVSLSCPSKEGCVAIARSGDPGHSARYMVLSDLPR